MNKSLIEFEQLVARAKQEDPPLVDVSHQVMYRISSVQSRYDRPLTLVAAWSTVAAVMVSVAGAYAAYSTADLSPILLLASSITP